MQFCTRISPIDRFRRVNVVPFPPSNIDRNRDFFEEPLRAISSSRPPILPISNPHQPCQPCPSLPRNTPKTYLLKGESHPTRKCSERITGVILHHRWRLGLHILPLIEIRSRTRLSRPGLTYPSHH